MTLSPPSFDHILSMTDGIGTFEHAEHAAARPGHGYCTDDMARVLVAVARQGDPSPDVARLGQQALRFLADAQGASGKVRNRRTARGWKGRATVEDCWGRSLWAFGTATRRAASDWMRQSALVYFDRGAQARSPHRRAMAFAALGAAEVLSTDPGHDGARRLLADAATVIGPLAPGVGWPWPEPRLSYANAVLPEALLAAGEGLGRPDLVADGLVLLSWLLERETVEGHLSPTPAGGSGPGDRAPGFDQQPIEIAAMADACARAAAVTGDTAWLAGIDLAARWFAGDNDRATPMWDPLTGGGYDGLMVGGPNLNQGTESTLALVTTLQQAQMLALAAPVSF